MSHDHHLGWFDELPHVVDETLGLLALLRLHAMPSGDLYFDLDTPKLKGQKPKSSRKRLDS